MSNDIGAQINHIVALFSQGRHAEVLDRLLPLLEILPPHAALLNLAGATYAGLGQLDEAIGWYDRSIAADSGFADAHNNRGLALRQLRRFDDALLSYDRAIALQPHSPSAHYNRGNILFDLQRLDAAVHSYDQAITQDPGHAAAYSNRGNSLLELGRLEDALASLDRAVTLAPALAAAHSNRGIVLDKLKRLDEALDSYCAAVRLQPDNVEPLGHMLLLKAQMCDWSAPEGIDLATIGIDGGAISPFSMLALDDDAGRHLRRSANWALAKYPTRPRHFPRPVPSHPRIRIGYFSTDFYNHATMWLMGKLLERHDESRFEVHAFSYGPDRHDVMRQRVVDSVDGFHDIRAMDDAATGELARSLGIDIAIDLKGYTGESRPGIFAAGVAPIQVAFLGYPGSLGAGFMDYIVADRVVIPASHRQHYAEKLICLPHCYQVNDDGRAIADEMPDRSALGLPREGFVFCCFNNNYKITADEFDIWMRLLGKVEGSIFWLLRDNDWAMANLRREAQRRGIAPDRLIFADRLPMAQHLARQRQADLFLDTFRCNAHTTASDALWAGLPVITRLGDGFAARVAGSLLHAIGLPELVTSTADEYERLALGLATDPARLAGVKARLNHNRTTSPLFDTTRFTRDLERGYELAFARHCQGLTPDHIEVAANDDKRAAA